MLQVDGAFEERLRQALTRAPKQVPLRVAKNQGVFRAGEPAECLYLLESGRIKLHIVSADGKECLRAIVAPGEVFGEACLAGRNPRDESATAMLGSTLVAVPSGAVLRQLREHFLLEDFVEHLVRRAAERERFIAALLTLDCERRLAETLLVLAHKLGRRELRHKRIDPKLTHEDLAQMVGTTRPRVTEFLRRFCALGLVALRRGAEPSLLIDEEKLALYVSRSAGRASDHPERRPRVCSILDRRAATRSETMARVNGSPHPLASQAPRHLPEESA